MRQRLRAIPAVERVLQTISPCDLPRATVVAVVRRELTALRQARKIPEYEAVVARVRGALDALRQRRLQPVINATGILIHTNLGRAPLGPTVIEALTTIASNYNNLEYDLSGGERGGRATYLEHNLALLCGSEAATVVNNCAAALVLVLRHFTKTRSEVVISRGELIQIGGGFRIPEILEASGARLREVGTTNKTSLEDYASAITSGTALILKVHRSNFLMDGFVASPETEELANLARAKRLPLVEDLGSGAIIATEQIPGLEHEPIPREVLARGVDIVTFSGDKLLGGPQAGILAGRSKLIAALKREPFFRAVRCDKLILAALQATVDSYLDGKPSESVLTLALLQTSLTDLQRRADMLRAALEGLPLQVEVGRGKAQVGGGSLPRCFVPSVTLDLVPTKLALDDLVRRLRAGSPPVIAYVSNGRCKLDLRTVFPTQDTLLLRRIRESAGP